MLPTSDDSIDVIKRVTDAIRYNTIGQEYMLVESVPIFDEREWQETSLERHISCFNFARNFNHYSLEPGATSSADQNSYNAEFTDFTALTYDPNAFDEFWRKVVEFLHRDMFELFDPDEDNIFDVSNLTTIFMKKAKKAADPDKQIQHDYHFIALRRLGKSDGLEDLVWAHKAGADKPAKVLCPVFDDVEMTNEDGEPYLYNIAPDKIKQFLDRSKYGYFGGLYKVPSVPRQFYPSNRLALDLKL